MSREADPLVILFDVNVLWDVLAVREPFFRDSATLLAACETGRCRGLVAARGVTTLAYLLGKHRGKATARQDVAALLRIVDVATVDSQVIAWAFASRHRDLEDAVQMGAALAAGAHYVGNP